MARTPVLFIPGITGSFNLSVLLDWRGPTLSGWDFPPFVDYGKQFVTAFERAGYTRNRDLFVVFYDWRKAVRDSAENYLKPWIARAKQRSGSAKVILIGHSMGGLVARTYIQSPGYANDVERLITLGTPHRGSAESYYAWGAGSPRADGVVQTAFNVYLWYLRHAHPFQTELNPVRTFRTQLPGVRDLLPIDNYLLNQGGPPLPKDEDQMIERNLWGDMLNQSAALATLFGRVPVTTLAGNGFTTIRTITVAGPPLPPGAPPLYPDGAPVSTQVEGNGDGTVLINHAQIDHPQARNLAALAVSHSALPDHPAVLAQVLGELGVGVPALEPPPAESTKLVIMTASPVTMEVQTPAGRPMTPPGVLGAAVDDSAPPRRPRRVRARDHGHAGKHLNIVVIDQPRPATIMCACMAPQPAVSRSVP
ncbi:MAG: alpha/beta fold hydrolase [Oscillochloris sp.]|nr:alpha/beta fold hydrolase [Oscillochloris sp.]